MMKYLLFALALVAGTADAATSIWGASARGTVVAADRIPVATGASSGPLYVTPLTLKTYLETGGTITVSDPILDATQTWNDGAVTFTGFKLNITDTASAAGSLLFDWQLGGASYFKGSKAGVYTFTGTPELNAATAMRIGTAAQQLYITGAYITGATYVAAIDSGVSVVPMALNADYFSFFGDGSWSSTNYERMSIRPSAASGWMQIAAETGGTGTDNIGVAFTPAGTGHVAFGTPEGATSATYARKAVTGIADATATSIFTVTVPNAAHSATVAVEHACSLGAGGAIGANEATGSVSYNISVARTTGVNAVATISSAYGSSSSSVAGAATITVTSDLGAVSGAVGDANTLTIRATVTKGSGSSDNHTCTSAARLLNANATGVTIS